MLKSINLKVALLANAIFSAVSGLILIVFSAQISQLMAILESLVLTFIGFGLLLFSAIVFFQSTRKPISRKQVRFIVIQDLLWVVGSTLIIVFQLFDLSTIGYAMVGTVAVIVGYFAYLQNRGLRSLKGD